MKIKSLEIKNIGIIVHEVIEFNKPLNLFYGEILAGKTTILNAVKLLFGGSFSNDLIRHGEKEAEIILKFDNGSIKRTFYIAKDGEIKDRAIEFIDDGEIVKKPTDAIKKLLNPFLLDQNFLINKSINDMRKYFIDLLDIDTLEIDTDIKILVDKAQDFRIKIKAAGDLDNLEEVEEPGSEDDLNKDITTLSSEFDDRQNYDKKIIVIETLEEELKKAKDELTELTMPRKFDIIVGELKETNSKISDLKADKILYDLYLKNKEKVDEKVENEAALKKNTTQQKAKAKEKIKLLTEISKNCKIKDLEFDKNGNIIYQKTAIDMLSTSQLMNLSSECSGLYPEGLGLELIDHAESLGFASSGSSREAVSIYVKRAKKENKTILATIVGENPSNLPEDVGVFIVIDGKLTKRVYEVKSETKEEDRKDQL